MVYIILAVVFVLFGLSLLLAGKVKQNSEKQYYANTFVTTGTVGGRVLNSDGPLSEYYIKVMNADGVEQEYLSQSFKPLAELMPGAEIRVGLAKKTTLGVPTYELRVLDERYAKQPKRKASSVLYGAAVAFFVMAAIMIMLRFV